MFFQLMVKTLQINKSRAGLIVAIMAVIAINSTILEHISQWTGFIEGPGQLLSLPLAFLSTLITASLIINDQIRHTNRDFKIFEALGAKRSTLLISIYITLALIAFGGVVIGTLLGAAISLLFQGIFITHFTTIGLRYLEILGSIILASGMGVAIGVAIVAFKVGRR